MLPALQAAAGKQALLSLMEVKDGTVNIKDITPKLIDAQSVFTTKTKKQSIALKQMEVEDKRRFISSLGEQQRRNQNYSL